MSSTARRRSWIAKPNPCAAPHNAVSPGSRWRPPHPPVPSASGTPDSITLPALVALMSSDMEATICTPKAPKVASMPERQPMKLPDEGATVSGTDRKQMLRRAMFAGLSGSASGSLGTPNMARPKLG